MRSKVINLLLVFGLGLGSSVAIADQGADIYQKGCAMCHAAGVAGAPILGDAAAWEPRISQGMDVLVASVVNGKNGMPAKGVCTTCTEDEIKVAVEYMLAQVK